ncbi:hypothetical protein AgCh_006200 [Apium graveolens]
MGPGRGGDYRSGRGRGYGSGRGGPEFDGHSQYWTILVAIFEVVVMGREKVHRADGSTREEKLLCGMMEARNRNKGAYFFTGIKEKMDGENGNNQNNNKNRKNNDNQGNNDEGGNIFDQLAETLAVLVNQQLKPNIVPQFKRLNPPTFDGATDPAVV